MGENKLVRMVPTGPGFDMNVDEYRGSRSSFAFSQKDLISASEDGNVTYGYGVEKGQESVNVVEVRDALLAVLLTGKKYQIP